MPYRENYPNHMPKPATMRDLLQAAHGSVFVKTHLKLWEDGGFATLEQALISLAVHQAKALEAINRGRTVTQDQPAAVVMPELQ